MQGLPSAEGRIPVLVILKHAVSKELDRREAVLDMLVRFGVDGDPGQDHDALRDGADLVEVGGAPIGLPDVTDSHQGLVDGLQQILVDRHLGAGEIGLLGLGGEQEEIPLLLEALEHFIGLGKRESAWLPPCERACPAQLLPPFMSRMDQRTCSEIKLPIALLSLTYLPTEPAMKASKSSIDSGSSSGGTIGAAGGGGGGAAAAAEAAFEAAAGVDAVEPADWGETIVCCRAGTACGSSIVEVAMSSRRAVAASSLESRAGQHNRGPRRDSMEGPGPIGPCKVSRAVSALVRQEGGVMDCRALDLPLNQGGEVVHIVGRHVCAVASLTLYLAGWFTSRCGTRIPRQWWKGG